MRITNPLYINMVCGKTTTTTLPVTTTAPPVLAWTTEIRGPSVLCGTTRGTYTATITLTPGRENYFLIRSAIFDDVNGALAFAGSVSANVNTLFCFFSSNRLSWRCDGPIEGPLTITVTFALANVTPKTGAMRFNTLVGRRDDDTTDTVVTTAITSTASC